MKSEPDAYSWQRLVKEKRTSWNGVRNYAANNNMKEMRIGDEAFFYHSNEGRCIVGIMKIVGLWHSDPDDPTGRFGMVDVAPVKSLKNTVTLAAIKADPSLSAMILLKQGRLSVSSVTLEEWRHICELAG